MNLLNKIILLLTISGLILSGCQKQLSRNQLVYINEHFRDTFDYKVGTYWVFYDSVSSAMDTFTISSSSRHAPVSNSNFSDNVEYIAKVISDTHGDSSQLSGLTISAPYYLAVSSDKGMFSHRLMYGLPFELKSEMFFFQTYSDMGNAYQNVYYSRSSYHGSYDYTFDCWFSPEIGFVTIKYTSSIMGSKSLHLVSHNIIR